MQLSFNVLYLITAEIHLVFRDRANQRRYYKTDHQHCYQDDHLRGSIKN